MSAGNSPSLQTSDIAFVPCDPTAYSGRLDANATLKIVLDKKPLAVLLYSTTTSACNYTADQSDYNYLFTLLSADTAKSIETQLGYSNRTGSSYILPDMASFAPTGSFDDSGGGGGGGTDSPNTGMCCHFLTAVAYCC